MSTVSPTVVIESTLIGWIVGMEGYSEVGQTTRLDGEVVDLSADVRIGVQPINVEYGISGSSPLDRIAETGTMTWAMDNSTSNSAGLQGYYSPGHANARSGWDIGATLRLKLTHSGTTYYKFVGNLIDIQPDAGQYDRQAVVCQAVDWIDEAARARVKDISIATDKRADQLITTLVEDSVSKQPVATSFATGESTFKYGFDNLLDAQTTVLRGLADCVLSELGYLYVKGNTSTGGVLTFESRHTRPKYGAADATFDNTMVGLRVNRGRQDITNRIYVVVHPRTLDGSATVLYELTSTETTPAINAGDTITLLAPFREVATRSYRIAGTSIVTPASGVDWIANAASDGSSTVLTTSVAVSHATTAANSVTFAITNNAAVTAYMTTLQVRGVSLKDVTETVMSATDDGSSKTYGEVDSRVDMKYESRAGTFGQEIADWILNTSSTPRYVVNDFTIASNTNSTLLTQSLAREPGDKIAFSEAVTGITATGASGAQIGYFINGVRLIIDAGNVLTTSWVLVPVDRTSAWVLNQVGSSEMGLTTSLGFA
jgi:hypothetical protein